MPTGPPALAMSTWVEFQRGMCETLNTARCLVMVGDDAVVRPLLPIVDAACARDRVAAAFPNTSTAEPAPSSSLTLMPRVLFTTRTNQATLQRCIAVYGRVPFLAVMDMCDDEDSHSFVLDLPGAGSVAVDTVADFLFRVGTGSEPRSRQGAPPPPGDACAPTHGMVLGEARSAVTSSFARLVGKSGVPCVSAPAITNAATPPALSASGAPLSPGPALAAAPRPCGAVCVFWSDRCPCCPGVLMLVESLVRLVRHVAARHTSHATAAHVSLDFPFLVANIDDNDFTLEEWPVTQREQVVPSLVAYTGAARTAILFAGERTPARLVDFLCDHCLPPADVVACVAHIRDEAMRVAAQLSIEELMTTVKEDSGPYQAAVHAWEALEAASSDDADDADGSKSSETAATTRAALLASLYEAYANVHASALPFSVEELARTVLAEGGAAGGRSRSASPSRAVGSQGEGPLNVAGRAPSTEAKTAAGTVVSGAAAVTQTSIPSSHKRPRE